jgi:archaellum component FlaC
MKKEEHTHLVRTDIVRNSELKGKLDSAQALETKLEAANLRMKDKISGLGKLLDNSNNENEQLKTTTVKLKDKVTELTLMLDNNRSILPPCHSLLFL